MRFSASIQLGSTKVCQGIMLSRVSGLCVVVDRMPRVDPWMNEQFPSLWLNNGGSVSHEAVAVRTLDLHGGIYCRSSPKN